MHNRCSNTTECLSVCELDLILQMTQTSIHVNPTGKVHLASCQSWCTISLQVHDVRLIARLMYSLAGSPGCLQLSAHRYGEEFNKVSKQSKAPRRPVRLLYFEGNHYNLLL